MALQHELGRGAAEIAGISGIVVITGTSGRGNRGWLVGWAAVTGFARRGVGGRSFGALSGPQC